jgi:ribosomal protein S11
VRFQTNAAFNDALVERVDEHGQVVGFSILGVSRFRKERPFEAELTSSK